MKSKRTGPVMLSEPELDFETLIGQTKKDEKIHFFLAFAWFAAVILAAAFLWRETNLKITALELKAEAETQKIEANIAEIREKAEVQFAEYTRTGNVISLMTDKLEGRIGLMTPLAKHNGIEAKVNKLGANMSDEFNSIENSLTSIQNEVRKETARIEQVEKSLKEVNSRYIPKVEANAASIKALNDNYAELAKKLRDAALISAQHQFVSESTFDSLAASSNREISRMERKIANLEAENDALSRRLREALETLKPQMAPKAKDPEESPPPGSP